MSLRDAIIAVAGPSFLGGCRAQDWLWLLKDNHFAVHPRYVLRALSISALSTLNSLLACYENRRYGERIQSATIEPPLFILGHWRSGTTLLHNLLAVDTRFACATLYEVLFPHTFLTTERLLSTLLAPLLPRKRLGDNVRLSFEMPYEDEFAICILSFRSPQLGSVFPIREQHYERYLTLRGLSETEIAEWRAALTTFLKKLTLKHRRPLVLKSPAHTCRVPLLLEMFPEARFVHIHRNPYAVFQSSRWTSMQSSRKQRLQRRNSESFDDRVLRQYRQMYELFFEERRLIAPGHFHEVGYEDLEKDPVREVRRLYETLQLPPFADVENAVRCYVDATAGYQKNVFPELPLDLRERIAREWRPCFEEWNYPT